MLSITFSPVLLNADAQLKEHECHRAGAQKKPGRERQRTAQSREQGISRRQHLWDAGSYQRWDPTG